MRATGEGDRQWPEDQCFAPVAMLEKGEGVTVEDNRPLTIFTNLYRAHAGDIYAQIQPWQQKWMLQGMKGAKLGAGTTDVTWPLIALSRVPDHWSTQDPEGVHVHT